MKICTMPLIEKFYSFNQNNPGKAQQYLGNLLCSNAMSFSVPAGCTIYFQQLNHLYKIKTFHR